MTDDGSEILSNITPSDITIDEDGRVIIANKKISDFLKSSAFNKVTPTGANNGCNFVTGGCQTNTVAHCGNIDEVVEA